MFSMRPSYYIVEPTTCCNLNCGMCPNRLLLEKGDMEFDIFRKAIDTISKDAKGILLYGLGEPMLHNRIFDMIRYAKTHTDAFIIIATNGTMLDADNSRRLIDAGPDKIVIGFDSLEPAIYEKMRNGAKFEKTLRNVTDFLELNSGRIRTTIIRVCSDDNPKEDLKHDEYFSRYGCDIKTSQMNDWLGIIKKKDRVSHYHMKCDDLGSVMYINWKGYVKKCCQDYNSKDTIGHISDRDIFKKYDREVGRKREIAMCAKCSSRSTKAQNMLYFEEGIEPTLMRP